MPSSRQRRAKRQKELMKKQEKQLNKANQTAKSVSGVVNNKTGTEILSTAESMMSLHHHDEQMRLHSKEISVRGLTIQFEDLVLLQNAHLRLIPGHRYCLHGANGTGKSTLLRHIATGTIPGFPRSLRTVLVEQEARGSDQTPLQIVMNNDNQRAELRARVLELDAKDMSTAEVEEYTSLLDELAELDLDTTNETRAIQMLKAVGFKGDKMINQPTEELSGGWRMRVTLACALYSEPDLLLLDEPTNMLDIKGIRWLEKFLTSDKVKEVTVLFVSHNRHFVDAVATDVVALAGKTLSYSPGNYTAFQKQRQELAAAAAARSQKDEAKRTALEKQLQHARQQNKVAQGRRGKGGGSAVRSVQTKLERVGEFTNARDFQSTWKTALKEMWVWGEAGNAQWKVNESTLSDGVARGIRFLDPEPVGTSRPLLQLDQVSFGYEAGHPLFTDLSLSIDASSRVAIVGPNGFGKSTILKVLAGDLTPTKGRRSKEHGARVTYFGQHQNFDLEKSAVQIMHDEFPDLSEGELRARLGSMGLPGNLALQKVGTLSGGQKARLGLAMMATQRPNVMLLDELTNHLDVLTIEVLVEALRNYKGAIVLVSHDEWFVNQLAPQTIWQVSPDGVKVVEKM